MNAARFGICVALGGVTIAAAASGPFAWKRPLLGTSEPRTLYRITIPSDVYDRCHQFPHDVRIFDHEGRPWPHDVRGARPQPAPQEWPLAVLNRTWFEARPDRPAYYRLDVRMEPAPDGSRRRHNRIRLTTPGNDFVRRVEIWGAETPGEWGLLGAGYVVRHRQPRRDEEIITYPEANYPYLQIRVYPNIRDALETVTVDRVRVLTQPPAPAQVTYVLEANALPVSSRDDRDEAQVKILDLGYQNHPVASFRFDVTDREFVRRVRLASRDDPGDPWRAVTVADLFRLGDRDQLTVRTTGRGRFWKIQIDHHDDPPLLIRSVTAHAPREEWLVEARSAGPAALYYGSAQTGAPRYDLAERVTRSELAVADLPRLALGPATANPAYRADWFQSLQPWLVPVAVALASIVVIYVTIQMLRRPLAA